MRELVVTGREAGQRFDKFLRKYLNTSPASFLYRMLRKKNITLNGAKAAGGELLQEGDRVTLYLSDETIAKFREETDVSSVRLQDLLILYEDDDVVFVGKPADLLTQSAKAGDVSVASLLPELLLRQGSLTSEDLRAFRPAPLSRLDRNTSGIVLCGKSMRGAQHLAECIRSRKLKKEYLAITHGAVPPDGIYRAWAKKDAGQNRMTLRNEPFEGSLEMVTGLETVKTAGEYALLRIDLITGRTHQIRAHLAHLRCPVTGDPKYGNRRVNTYLRSLCGVSRQMLHAERVTFPDGEKSFPNLTGRTFSADVPEDFQRALASLKLSGMGI